MIRSVFLCVSTQVIFPLMLLVSLLLLFRGHHDTGGGFSGGLVAAAAFALHSLAFGVEATRATLRTSPRTLLIAGAMLALASGVVPLALGRDFLTALYVETVVAGIAIAFGTVLLLELGIFLIVLGSTLTIVFSIERGGPGVLMSDAEEREWRP